MSIFLNTEEQKWLSDVFRKIDFLSVLTIGQFDKLTSCTLKKHFHKKTAIFNQGDKGEYFYIVYDGTVSIWASKEGGEKKRIAKLNPGGYFGESALISGEPRNATAIADTKVDLFILSKNDFNALMRGNIQLENKMREIMARRTSQRSLELFYSESEKKNGFFSKILKFFGAGSK
ncbi:cyclic nucleotide-binding domain-containing protein [bacterium]|nr:cyclic nucleotide-binding domain-containing protein [bacterium]MBU3955690.1 cyclic nucleotide-binding domain-containing protein [bacterium]